MILVCGATGTVGGEVLRLLSASGVPTRALVRSPERADALRGYDTDTVVGNFHDAPSLDAAVAGTEAVFLASPASSQQVAQECAVIDAAARVHARVVKLAAMGWQHGTIGRFGSDHRHIIDHLAAAGVPYSVLAPSEFLQNIFRSAAAIQSEGVLAMPLADAALAAIDARDIAAVAEHLLTTDAADGASHELTGPEALTGAKVAGRLSALLGKEVRYVDADPTEDRARLLDAGADPWLVDGRMELYEAYRAGHGAAVTDEVSKVTGREPHTVDDFLARYRSAFA